MKLTKTIKFVPKGQIYPITIEKGEDCPSEYLDVAKRLDAVDTEVDTEVEQTGPKRKLRKKDD